MAKVLLLGYDPPPLVRHAKIEAAHYRTWQFLEPLLTDGHTVALCAGDPVAPPSAPEIPDSWRARLQYAAVPFSRRGWKQHLQRLHDRFAPDCIVAVNFSHCLYATRLRTSRPMWMDVYGDYLTIIQAAAYRAQSNRGLETSIAFAADVLRAGDAFSVCSEPQQHALVGELAMAGRLNRETFGYPFAHIVRPGVPAQRSAHVRDRATLAPHGITDADFVVLWCGGYNTWTDVDTLFTGIERAMTQNARIHFVSVGASTYQGPDNMYDRFLGLTDRSLHRHRFHMLGWQPWSELAGYYRASDVGLNVDAMHYETIYGTRTRLVEMISAGLPIITSRGPELSVLLEREHAARAFVAHEPETLTACVVALAEDEVERATLAARAAEYAQRELSFDTTTAALRTWVRAPQRAPDRSSAHMRTAMGSLVRRGRTAGRRLLWKIAALDR